MIGEIWSDDGGAWQKLIARLIARKHGGNFQEIPDTEGDFGLEGFTLDDHTAYQCYAPKEPLSTQLLYEKQRDKITADIKKFIDNRKDLSVLFDGFKVRRWMLVVPRFESRRLLQHARRKSNEVIDAQLPYVANDFQVTVQTANLWEYERTELIRSGLDQLMIDPSPTAEAEFPIESKHIDNLTRKLKKVSEHGRPKMGTQAAKRIFINQYVKSESILSKLSEINPEIFIQFNQIKSNKEQFLEIESMTTGADPNELISITLKSLQDTLNDEIPGLSGPTVEHLRYGTLSSWFLHCNLDFICEE